MSRPARAVSWAASVTVSSAALAEPPRTRTAPTPMVPTMDRVLVSDMFMASDVRESSPCADEIHNGLSLLADVNSAGELRPPRRNSAGYARTSLRQQRRVARSLEWPRIAGEPVGDRVPEGIVARGLELGHPRKHVGAMYAVVSGVNVDAADYVLTRIENGEREPFPIDEVSGMPL